MFIMHLCISAASYGTYWYSDGGFWNTSSLLPSLNLVSPTCLDFHNSFVFLSSAKVNICDFEDDSLMDHSGMWNTFVSPVRVNFYKRGVTCSHQLRLRSSVGSLHIYLLVISSKLETCAMMFVTRERWCWCRNKRRQRLLKIHVLLCGKGRWGMGGGVTTDQHDWVWGASRRNEKWRVAAVGTSVPGRTAISCWPQFALWPLTPTP